MTTLEKRITTDQFEAFIARPEHADRRFELIDGEIVEKAMPNFIHGYITMRLGQSLNNYFDTHPEITGFIVGEGRVRPANDDANDRLPDAAIIVGEQQITDDSVANYIPPICIEVKSKSDRFPPLRQKAEFYLTHSAVYALIFIPAKRAIEIHTEEAVTLLDAAAVLTFPDLLPGFSVSVDKLFPPESV
ncbi:MAG: Uma2 family endonuclease [Chloroflexota bacterium]|nr:Uma2 family endonuclease [Chloroflexota bacterium]